MNPNTVSSISDKISKSKLSSETREIFSMLVSFFGEILKEKDEKVKNLEEKVDILQDQVRNLEESIDSNSQYERRDTFTVSGDSVPLCTPNEDCKSVINNLFRTHLNLNVETTEISTAHRLGKKPTGPDRRSIIVKVCRRDQVKDIFTACKTVKPPFYVNPALTPTRSKIMYTLRQLRKKFPSKILGCRAINGDPRVILKSVGRSTRRNAAEEISSFKIINTKHALESFVRNELKTTLCDAGVTW